MQSEILNTPAAADYLTLAKSTLEHWRLTGDGPAYSKIGGRVVYRKADLDAYIDARMTTSTSIAKAA